MANVIVYKNGNAQEMTPGRIVTPGENGSFDTVTERWYYGGQVTSTHVAGSTTAPQGLTGDWLCMGTSDIERLPGGASIATVTWRGLLNSSGGVYVTETRGVRETSYDSISGIPGTTGFVQGRLLDTTVGASVRAITKTPSNFKPNFSNNNTSLPNGIPTPTVQKMLDVINTAKIYTYPYGWICYSWQAEEPLKGIFLVSAEYRYEHKVIFGGS